MSYGDLVTVDRPIKDVWYAEGGGPGSPAWFVLVHREGYTQEFWFANETAANRFACCLERD
jgi:hypothetical protein